MQFYRVLVGSSRYHGSEPLTYSSGLKLNRGSVVVVPLQSRPVLGIVVDSVSSPNFKTKEIVRRVGLKTLCPEILELLDWLKVYYPAPLGSITSQFLPSSLLSIPKNLSEAEKLNPKSKKLLPSLTKEQRSVVNIISKSAKNHSSWFLHGETGSGKTRVYMELTKQTLKMGRSVLVLTPEIGLAPQLTKSFKETFSTPVFVYHSNLTPAAKRQVWLKILEAEKPLVVIGPRSALFSPIKNLGLIVIDEAHEPAYKQEQVPYYYAPRVAAKLAQIHKAKLISGTATPSIADYHMAKTKNIPILRMKELAIANTHLKPTITIINFRDRSQFERHPYLSDPLLIGLEKAVSRHEQAIIFLNRRGSARIVLCQNCGWQAHCPVCDLPLTYHQDNHLLRCHTCGYKKTAVSNCPICSSSDVIFKSAGTKAIVDGLAKLFPKARIKRFDTDNPAAEKLERQYGNIKDGDVDILVGTQMLGKGLDLPKLGFLGVVSADTSLSFPDFTSEERTYQLLYQIIGRIGRGHRAGNAVIQTFQPKSLSIVAATGKDWPLFYKNQLEQRQKFGFPPFYHLLRLTVTRKTHKAAEHAANELKNKLAVSGFKVELVGPSPDFYEKSRGSYHWQLVVRAKSRSELLKVIASIPTNWSYDIDPINLL